MFASMLIECSLVLKFELIMQLMCRMNPISLNRLSKFGILRPSLYFHNTYLKVSKTSRMNGLIFGLSGWTPYQYKSLNSAACFFGTGSSFAINHAISPSVIGQVQNRWSVPSLLAVLLSIILQKVHLGSTVSSNAFIRLFNGSWLFLKRNRKLRRSFGR